MVTLIDDLLDVSRITRGMITLQREPVLIGAIVARAVETVRPAIDAHRHELTLELPDELITVDGDKTRSDSGPCQHPSQRVEVHGSGRPNSPQGDARRFAGRNFGIGYRDWYSSGAHSESLRPFHAGAFQIRTRSERTRHRLGFGASAYGDARRNGDGSQRGNRLRHRIHSSHPNVGDSEGCEEPRLVSTRSGPSSRRTSIAARVNSRPIRSRTPGRIEPVHPVQREHLGSVRWP